LIPRTNVSEAFSGLNKKKASTEITKLNIKNLNNRIAESNQKIYKEYNKALFNCRENDSLELGDFSLVSKGFNNHNFKSGKSIFRDTNRYSDITGNKKPKRNSDFLNEQSKWFQLEKKNFDMNYDSHRIQELNARLKGNKNMKSLSNITQAPSKKLHSRTNTKDMSSCSSFFQKMSNLHEFDKKNHFLEMNNH